MTNFRSKLLFLTNHKKIGNLSANFIVISNHSIRFMTNNLHCTTDSVTVSHKSSLHLLYHRYLLRLAGWWRLLNNFWRCLGTVTNGAVRVCVGGRTWTCWPLNSTSLVCHRAQRPRQGRTGSIRLRHQHPTPVNPQAAMIKTINKCHSLPVYSTK